MIPQERETQVHDDSEYRKYKQDLFSLFHSTALNNGAPADFLHGLEGPAAIERLLRDVMEVLSPEEAVQLMETVTQDIQANGAITNRETALALLRVHSNFGFYYLASPEFLNDITFSKQVVVAHPQYYKLFSPEHRADAELLLLALQQNPHTANWYKGTILVHLDQADPSLSKQISELILKSHDDLTYVLVPEKLDEKQLLLLLRILIIQSRPPLDEVKKVGEQIRIRGIKLSDREINRLFLNNDRIAYFPNAIPAITLLPKDLQTVLFAAHKERLEDTLGSVIIKAKELHEQAVNDHDFSILDEAIFQICKVKMGYGHEGIEHILPKTHAQLLANKNKLESSSANQVDNTKKRVINTFSSLWQKRPSEPDSL